MAELKRRKVYRVATAYVVVGAGIIGLGEAALPSSVWEGIQIPVGLIILLGLPIALILAWAYEVKPEEPGADRTVSADLREGSDGLDPLRVAVLPFANISRDPEDEYFADGMMEELISVLSRISGLDVIARTSVMQYKGGTTGVAQIGRELRVGTLLEGSVRKAGEKLRVTVQLINCETEGHLWAEDYDRGFAEVFEVQQDIAHHVARSLELRLLAGDVQRIERQPTTHLEAYDLYLLGRYQMNRRSDEGIRRAMEHFEGAIEMDPGFALAHAGLSESLGWAMMGYCPEPPPDALSRAEATARRAVELEGASPEARVALSFALMNLWEFDGAEEEVKRAIELNPGSAEAHQRYAHCLYYDGRFEESLVAFERALELDPRSALILTESAWPFGYMGDHDRGLERYGQALEIDPRFALAHFDVGWSYQRKGMFAEARSAYEKGMELAGRLSLFLGWFATLLVETGEEEDARAVLEELLARHGTGEKISAVIALVYEALGEAEAAFDWLERSYQERDPVLGWILISPELGFRGIRSDERFTDLRLRIRGKRPR